MATDDSGSDDDTGTAETGIDDGDAEGEGRSSRERLEEGADRAVEELDRRVIDLLSWLLDTETRAKIYIYLHQHPASTSEEVATGTGLYPSTVREALAELHDEEIVEREKREESGAGNNPYEYTAIAPSDLVGGIVGQVQEELNAVFNLDSYLGRDEEDADADAEPVTITVDEESGDEAAEGDGDDAE
jgi:predicted transcriptional regulator